MASSITLYADTSGKLFADTASNRIEVTFTYTTAGSITGFTPKSYPGPLEIPNTLGGVSVTSIGDQAFTNCTSLTSIIIPASVTSIRTAAFKDCINLTSVTFASGSQLLTIGSHVFNNCPRLTSIIIPVSVTAIDHSAFYGCFGLATVTFLGNVPSFSSYVFTAISPSANAYYISNTNNIDLAQYFENRVTQMVFT